MTRKMILLAGVISLAGAMPVMAGEVGPITQVSDVIVPEIFTPSTQLITQEKSKLVQSGAVVTEQQMNALLAGEGLTFNLPFFKDLSNDEENISSDDADDSYVDGQHKNSKPKKTSMGKDKAVRMSRNQSWSSADLVTALIDKDPMSSISSRVGDYWSRRLQVVFISIMKGIFAMNDLAPTNGSTHTKDDLTFNASTLNGGAYKNGVTDFTAENFLDALITMGDSDAELSLIMVHSIVLNTMRKKNLIDYIPDSEGKTMIPTYMGRTVIVDDGMPHTAGVFESWLFGAGAIRMGTGSPKVATAVTRKEDSGNGGGSEVLYNRVEWLLHPLGHQYVGNAPDGGPSNAATANNLAAPASWIRSYPERKQIKIARLVTREF